MHSNAGRSEIEHVYVRVFRALIASGARHHDAEDAIQDAYEAMLRVAAPPADPAAWLYIVASRRWRRGRWRSWLFMPLNRHSGISIPGPTPLAVALVTELERLTDRERSVIAARYVLGLSQRETGTALGIAVGTVAAITHRASTKLRERLREV